MKPDWTTTRSGDRLPTCGYVLGMLLGVAVVAVSGVRAGGIFDDDWMPPG